MTTLSHYISKFESHFNPTIIDGNKLIDPQSGFFLSYRIDIDENHGINLVIQFGYKQNTIQNWGCSGNKEEEKHFLAYYMPLKNKIYQLEHEQEKKDYDVAVKILNW